ncbi:DNA adenine methylase [Roseisolibacter agri]|uniref:site-specific DNA-methyltransferase (adenine-specific) n=1 Tax=Roseisolibacter agri TaxID=2014610 RepID=A0AA37Q8M1_9BACT|nr:DNA adenine methylase [Roseisolibacter agri]GLC25051.1 DNA methyltransferase [Roseisolibacter agri]
MPRYRTPLRYPGGKQRLAPFIAEILEANDADGWAYAEPYAGGAGVAMELLMDRKVSRVYLNDSSRHIYAFWKSILDQTEEFCRKISRVSLTLEAWRRHREVVRHPDDHDLLELGFSTFFLNRCNRSGVLTAGVIGGKEQVGKWRIDARFPRTELITRIQLIANKRRQISVSNMDAEKFMTTRVPKLPESTLVYCDPPYFQRAERLYLNTYEPEDHGRLASTIQQKLQRPWLVSYDGHPTILDLYRDRRQFTYSLQYSAIESYQGTEVFVFSDDLELPDTSRLSYIDEALATL